MFINPQQAIDLGWVTGIVNAKKQVQPNAIDFTLDTLMSIDNTQTAYISEGSKVMRDNAVVLPNNGIWTLDGGRVYDGTSDLYVKVPQGVAAVLWTRSTFARNGVFIISGLYDTGYTGHVGFTIYTMGGPIEIEKGTRIGQIAFIKAENAGVYAGGWNHEQGTTWDTKALEQGSTIPAGGSRPAGTQSFI
jgi:deoxycytidine triphosphate deaminase